MAVLLGSLAISNRSSLAELASAYQSQSREARAAADSGMTAVVSELNRPRNRHLLVNACLLETATTAAIATDPRVKVVDRPSFANVSITFPTSDAIPTTQTINIGDGSDGSQQRWRLIDVDCSGATADNVKQGTVANPRTGADAVPPRTGELTLTVRGEALRGGVVVATSTLQQTLEVVPKCLDRSLRGLNKAFGNDIRRCDLAPNFGFVSGAAHEDSGVIEIRGNAYDINIDPVTCVASSPLACDHDLAHTGVMVVDVELPPPLLTANTFCSGNSSADCNVEVTSNLTLASRNFGSWPATWKTICRREDINGGASPPGVFHNISCSLNSLSTGNKTELIFDTSGNTADSTIPVRLHFPNPAIGNEKIITHGNGSSGIYQCDSDAGAITCTSDALGAPRAADLALFGFACPEGDPSPCPPSPHQYLDLGSGNGATKSMFLYFPYGSITMGGNPSFKGVIWTNGFLANGNLSVTISSSDLESVCSLMRFCGGDDSLSESFAIDYVTRAVLRHTYS
ncbi:hypothetical protein [Synechococcus sp. BA-132 BA5]|uniref:hypothetical protein n=1 Tax=Synechococcus sp. BA-132 BA5 TaxID=3110252 RepID=UPI002B1FE647|nr:hypothetical protein [Synechococcus sp. BA-132 BA5]